MVSGKVNPVTGGAVVKARVNNPPQSDALDPKPGELSMVRLNPV